MVMRRSQVSEDYWEGEEVCVCVHEVGFVFRGVERTCDLSFGIRKFSFMFDFLSPFVPQRFFFTSLFCYLNITNTSDLIGHKKLISLVLGEIAICLT